MTRRERAHAWWGRHGAAVTYLAPLTVFAALLGGGALVHAHANTSALPRVAEACSQPSSTIGAEGRSFHVHATTADDIDNALCVMTGTGAPSWVIDHANATRALDGMQTDTWGPYTARWTYAKGEGFNLTIVDGK